MESRKAVQERYYALRLLLERIEISKNAFESIDEGEGYQLIFNTTKATMEKQKALRDSLPTGHRYQGDFYIRKPYSNPVVAVPIKGVIFLREDLVSWRIESSEGDVHKQYSSYYRDINKDKNLTTRITKDDATLVYD